MTSHSPNENLTGLFLSAECVKLYSVVNNQDYDNQWSFAAVMQTWFTTSFDPDVGTSSSVHTVHANCDLRILIAVVDVVFNHGHVVGLFRCCREAVVPFDIVGYWLSDLMEFWVQQHRSHNLNWLLIASLLCVWSNTKGAFCFHGFVVCDVQMCVTALLFYFLVADSCRLLIQKRSHLYKHKTLKRSKSLKPHV